MKKSIVGLVAALALTLAPLSARAAGVDFSNSEPRDAQSEPIACTQSLLHPPGGLDVDCGRYPLSNQHCYKQGYVVQGKANGPSIFVYAMTGHGGRGCGIATPQSVRTDMVMAIKKYRPFVRDDATDWAKKPFELKHTGLALFFESPNKARDGQCVAFYQPGAPVIAKGGDSQVNEPYLRDYYYRGWVCAPPGQTLTKDAAYDLIKSFTVVRK